MYIKIDINVVVGTSTMLSFITLNGGLTKNLPKVSYIKASEVWFLGCSTFIFCAMAEFAFVNVIWRRRLVNDLRFNHKKSKSIFDNMGKNTKLFVWFLIAYTVSAIFIESNNN